MLNEISGDNITKMDLLILFGIKYKVRNEVRNEKLTLNCLIKNF